MEFFIYYRKEVIWGVVDNHVVEEVNYNDEIGLRGVGFYFGGNTGRGFVDMG